jgi:hypothetical protein
MVDSSNLLAIFNVSHVNNIEFLGQKPKEKTPQEETGADGRKILHLI